MLTRHGWCSRLNAESCQERFNRRERTLVLGTRKASVFATWDGDHFLRYTRRSERLMKPNGLRKWHRWIGIAVNRDDTGQLRPTKREWGEAARDF